MKIKRIAAISIFLLFLASVAVFMAFGPQIRAALSPEVTYDYPNFAEAGGRMLNVLPSSAVWTGEDGGMYVWKISRSDEFPEPAFVVNACPLAIEKEKDGKVYFGFSYGSIDSSDAVAVGWDTDLKEGMCVRPER